MHVTKMPHHMMGNDQKNIYVYETIWLCRAFLCLQFVTDSVWMNRSENVHKLVQFCENKGLDVRDFSPQSGRMIVLFLKICSECVAVMLAVDVRCNSFLKFVRIFKSSCVSPG